VIEWDKNKLKNQRLFLVEQCGTRWGNGTRSQKYHISGWSTIQVNKLENESIRLVSHRHTITTSTHTSYYTMHFLFGAWETVHGRRCMGDGAWEHSVQQDMTRDSHF